MTDAVPEQQNDFVFGEQPRWIEAVGAELRDIKAGLRRSQHRDQFTLNGCFDVRPKDIQRSLLDESPQIVHFAGSGQGESGLFFEDESGQSKTGQSCCVGWIICPVCWWIKCVILNGCYTKDQANAIAQHIDYVIGMQQGVNSEAAIAFSVGFYDALGGRSRYWVCFWLGLQFHSARRCWKIPWAYPDQKKVSFKLVPKLKLPVQKLKSSFGAFQPYHHTFYPVPKPSKFWRKIFSQVWINLWWWEGKANELEFREWAVSV